MYKDVIFAALVALLFIGCSSGYSPQENQVVVHELSDPEMLNPINVHDNTGQLMCKNLFQTLLDIDFKTLELIPVLAQSRPLVETPAEGGMRLTYQIRPQAKWDNGSPITAKDVEFTLKVIKNPKVNNQSNKVYFEFIDDVVFYDNDPLKFTLVCKTVYMLAEASCIEMPILPAYVYDPQGLMKDFTVKQLNDEKDKLTEDPKINEFAKDFNSEKRMREKEFISGSGAYKLQEWITGQRVVFVKKNWWGDTLSGTNCYFDAFMPKIVHQTVNDQTSAIVSLKAGNLDVMRSIKVKDFVELPQSEKFMKSFNIHTPMTMSYTYLGINTKLPKFSDKRVRKALAHVVDVDKIIKVVMYNLAKRTIGPVHPSNIEAYNSSIVPYEYNIEKAKQLLEEAGWKDTNGDGTIDKIIDGEKQEFNINFTVNSGNDMRKQTALMFQEEARKVGINVSVTSQEWSVYIEKQKKHDFEMFFGAWITSPIPEDLKQVYHTESALNEGSNYVSFGNTETDALIDSVRICLDEKKRNSMYQKFQEILHEEATYIYLYAPTERIAINKRFTNADASVMRPGYWEQAFKLADAPVN